MDSWRGVLLAAMVLLAGCAGSPAGGDGAGGDTPTPTTAEDAADGVATTAAPTTDADATPTTTGATPTAEAGLTATVVAVASADTFVVRYANGSVDRVRLPGVVAPPAHDPPDPTAFAGVPDDHDGEDCLRAVGTAAETALSDRLVGERVTLLPGSERRRDVAGRLLAAVVHDGERVDHLLALRGFARVADGGLDDRSVARSNQAAARDSGAGVWRCSALNWEFGSNTTLSVVDVHADAGGSAPDYRYLEDEYVVLNNTGSEPVDLSGWQLKDPDDGLNYDFPDGFVLPAGENVTLHSGEGADRARHLYWGLTGEAWDDDGDALYLHRPNGSVALRYEYGTVNRTAT